MRRLVTPLPRRWVLWPALVIGAITLPQTAGVLDWTYLDWYTLSRVPFAALAITGPVVAACAAFVAASTRAETSPLGSAAAIRSGAPTVRRHLTVIAPAWAAAFALSFAPSFVYGAVIADDGSAHLPTVLATLASFIAFLSAGYAVGTAFPRPLAPLIALAVTGALNLVLSVVPPNYGNPVLMLLPTREAVVGRVGQSLSTGPILWQSLFFLLCALAVLAFTAAWPRRREVRAWAPPALAIAVAVTVAALMVNAGLSAIHRSQDVPSSCKEAGGVKFCVAQARLVVLDDVIYASDQTMDLVGGYPDGLTAISDSALNPETQARPLGVNPAAGAALDDLGTIWIGLASGTPVADSVRPQLINYLSGRSACAHSATPSEPSVDVEVNRARASDLQRYLSQASFGDIVPSQAVRSWYQAHASEIIACEAPELPDEILPQATQ